MNKKEKWTQYDEEIALYLYIKCKRLSNSDRNKIITEHWKSDKNFFPSLDSLKMKLLNIQYLETGKGLSNYNKACKRIYDNYRAAARP